MTETIVLGVPKERADKIVFEKILTDDLEVTPSNSYAWNKPSEWNYVELICKDYSGVGSYDLIFAYNDPDNRSAGVLYLGHWNGGVV